MRQIKFRCWSNHDKRFLTADTPTYHFFIRKDYRFTYHYLHFDEELFHLQQFTGLLDKNGKEIYEGDILKNEYEEIRVVEWKWGKWHETAEHGESAAIMNSGFRIESHGNKYEIVGNIYEFPELLNNK